MDLTIDRNGSSHLNGAPSKGEQTAKTRKPRKSKSRKGEPGKAGDHLHVYAYAGVGIMSALSAVLNGYANSLHSPSLLAGWAMGITIPLVILVLGKVAALLYARAGWRRLAYATGAAGAGLLLLSVWHCAVSIAALTGSPVGLALPMAVAIDVGFVCCELAVLAK